MFKYKKIKEFRKAKGKSKQAVIDDLLTKHDFKVSRPTWSTWEAGETVPGADVVGILCNYFGVSSNEFYS